MHLDEESLSCLLKGKPQRLFEIYYLRITQLYLIMMKIAGDERYGFFFSCLKSSVTLLSRSS